MTELESADRRFFALISKAIFSNPFGVERTEIEAVVTAEAVEQRPYEHLFSALIAALNEHFARLEKQGLDTIQALQGEDRELLGNAFLFAIYHRFIPELEALIQTELRQPGTPATAPFAGEVLGLMRARGFSEKTALRYFALFYQLRRAYYFIARNLVGDSPSMKQLRLSLWNNVFTYDAHVYERYLWTRMEDFSTLVLGETGTGKGAAAAAIGRSGYIPFDPKRGCFSESFTATFNAINLSQFPESLIESELFGHRKGAFTGAVDHHKGVFERCSAYGSLFLDEIGDASVAVQIKLLRVLQERTFLPVGSHEPLRFSGRVIAATNQSLAELRRHGRFRDDFFYRLCSDIITVPPLRQRIAESRSELESLVRLQIQRLTGQDSADLSALILETLDRDLPPDYPWPGNVRELEQALRRILLTRHYHGDLQAGPPPEDTFSARLHAGELAARELLGHYCTLLYRRWRNYEEVARRTGLDRRTVKKYVQQALVDPSLRSLIHPTPEDLS